MTSWWSIIGTVNDMSAHSTVYVRKRKAHFSWKRTPNIRILLFFLSQCSWFSWQRGGICHEYLHYFFADFSFADKSNISTQGVLLFGGVEIQDSDKLLEQAVDLAKDADGVIAIVGLNDWETGGNWSCNFSSSRTSWRAHCKSRCRQCQDSRGDPSGMCYLVVKYISEELFLDRALR